MKKSKKNYTIIVLIVLLLALAIGYAAFSATLTINGTAEGTGTWDVHFESAVLRNSTGAVDPNHGTATITAGDAITANVELAYPGDGVILEAVVKNGGSIPAKLTNFTVVGADEDLEITQAVPVVNEVIDANGTCTAQFAVKWKTNSTAESLNKTFTVTYDYAQDTTEVTLTPAHKDA